MVTPTGAMTTARPLIRPTEVEFEFTVNGKVDMPNACVVFTERPFEAWWDGHEWEVSPSDCLLEDFGMRMVFGLMVDIRSFR